MKRRYMFTLTEGRVEEFQAFVKANHLAPSTLSGAVDGFIRDLLPILRKIKADGGFTIKDLFSILGDQLELAQQGGQKNETVARDDGKAHEKQKRKKAKGE